MSRNWLAVGVFSFFAIATGHVAFGQEQDAVLRALPSVAVLDVQKVFDNAKGFKDRMEEIRKDAEAFEQVVITERDSISKISEAMDGLDETDPARQQLLKQATDVTQDLQMRIQEKRKEMLAREAALYLATYRQIQLAVAAHCRANGIVLVVKAATQPAMDDESHEFEREEVLRGVNRNVVFEDNIDITDAIIKQTQAPISEPELKAAKTKSE
jgi:hypothetical protein